MNSHPTPDTAWYYHVAYMVAACIYLAYIGSLWYRWRKVRR